RGPRRRHARLAAARQRRLRLRSGFPAGRIRSHLRRDDERGEARSAAARARPLAPRPRLPQAGASLLAAAGSSLGYVTAGTCAKDRIMSGRIPSAPAQTFVRALSVGAASILLAAAGASGVVAQTLWTTPASKAPPKSPP